MANTKIADCKAVLDGIRKAKESLEAMVEQIVDLKYGEETPGVGVSRPQKAMLHGLAGMAENDVRRMRSRLVDWLKEV